MNSFMTPLFQLLRFANDSVANPWWHSRESDAPACPPNQAEGDLKPQCLPFRRRSGLRGMQISAKPSGSYRVGC
jgi:hypothetical protein